MIRYSPFDLDRVISKVLVKKKKKKKKGSFYKKDKQGYFFMCRESDKGSVKMTYTEVKKQAIKLPIVTLNDLKTAIKTIKPTNKKNGEEQYVEFCKKNNLPV